MELNDTTLTTSEKYRMMLFYWYVNLPSIVSAALGFLITDRSAALFTVAFLSGIWLNHSAYEETKAIVARPDMDQHVEKAFGRLSMAFRLTCGLVTIVGTAVLMNGLLQHLNK